MIVSSFKNGEYTESEVDWDEMIEYCKGEYPYIQRYITANGYFQQLQSLKNLYLKWLVPHNEDGRCNDIPFEIDPVRLLLNQAERVVYGELIYFGLQMYPQYPILKYFVDFADPYRKIAIEVDGAAYHKDGQKDLDRHMEIINEGWSLFHITGSDTMRFVPDFFELANHNRPESEDNYYYDSQKEVEFIHHRERILTHCSAGIICCIKGNFYRDIRGIEGFYLPSNMDDVECMIAEISSNFYSRCYELISNKKDSRQS